MNEIELIATVAGVLCVWLLIRQNIWGWPVGLVQVGLYVWIFYEARLYSDVLLHVIYVGLSIFGWYKWLSGGPRDNPLPVTRLSPVAAILLVLGAIGATAGIGYLMGRFARADLPYWDAAIMVLSLIAQYLLARKILESWLFWIAVDVLAIGVYFTKALYLTTGLYGLFLGMALWGWFAWRKTRVSTGVNFAGGAGSSLGSSSPRTAGTRS